MQDVLFLVHRIPYPPNKGDKIRSFNLLKWLSRRYRVHLGCFVDEPNDFKYVNELEPYTVSQKILYKNRNVSFLKGSVGLVIGKTLTVPYYSDSRMSAWVRQIVKEFNIKSALVFSSSMAQFLDDFTSTNMNIVIDFVDVDSDKWYQYSKNSIFPLSFLYWLEYRQLLSYEKKASQKFSASVFITAEEKKLFERSAGHIKTDKFFVANNGVDTEYFDPAHKFDIGLVTRFSLGSPYICFCGAMDYKPNVDAVTWFVENIWQAVVVEYPDSKFLIVGSNPTHVVSSLVQHRGVIVTGSVLDVRPFLKFSNAVVAPLRIARGIQNKVLESLAMGKYLIATERSMEGLVSDNTLEVLISEEPEVQKLAVCDSFRTKYVSSINNRNYVINNYCWETKLRIFAELMEG